MSVNRVSREDLKAKIMQETGCTSVPGDGLRIHHRRITLCGYAKATRGRVEMKVKAKGWKTHSFVQFLDFINRSSAALVLTDTAPLRVSHIPVDAYQFPSSTGRESGPGNLHIIGV